MDWHPCRAYTARMDTITIAAGCFWGVEKDMRALPGVTDAEVGYAGGTVIKPYYEQVCSGQTGHAEAVRVTFDSSKTSARAILDAFFVSHDATTLNRQGPDIGTQYRSAIFYRTPEEKAIAEEAKAAAQASSDKPIVTSIEALGADGEPSGFWRAEEYHQQYLAKKGGTCHS
jgi:peptide-methionine (S)-S-oxide reductase